MRVAIGVALSIFVAVATLAAALGAPPAVKSRALTSDVVLPPEMIERVDRNRALFDRAKGSEKGFCAFVADSVALVEPFGDAVTSAPSPPDDPDGGSDAYGADAAGVSVGIVEGGVHKNLHWKNLLAAASPASRPLVRATQALTDDGFGAWTQQETDYGGCHQPARARPALERLAAAWAGAPACLREALRPELVRLLSWMADQSCFCEPVAKRAQIKRQLAANARVLSQVAGLGEPFAKKLRVLTSAPSATFGCIGPG